MTKEQLAEIKKCRTAVDRMDIANELALDSSTAAYDFVVRAPTDIDALLKHVGELEDRIEKLRGAFQRIISDNVGVRMDESYDQAVRSLCRQALEDDQ